MKKGFIISAVVIIFIGGIIFAYVAGSKGTLPDISLPDLTKPSVEDLYHTWAFSDILVLDSVSGEYKPGSNTSEVGKKYLEFKNDGSVCVEGKLDERGLPEPCDVWGTYTVDGRSMNLRGGSVPPYPIEWDIKGGKLEFTIDVRDVPVPQDPNQPQPLKFKLVLTKMRI